PPSTFPRPSLSRGGGCVGGAAARCSLALRLDVQDPESLMTPKCARPFLGISDERRLGAVDAGPGLRCSEPGPARVARGDKRQVFGTDELRQLLGCRDCSRTGRRSLAMHVSGPW